MQDQEIRERATSENGRGAAGLTAQPAECVERTQPVVLPLQLQQATLEQLGRLCAKLGLSQSRLVAMSIDYLNSCEEGVQEQEPTSIVRPSGPVRAYYVTRNSRDMIVIPKHFGVVVQVTEHDYRNFVEAPGDLRDWAGQRILDPLVSSAAVGLDKRHLVAAIEHVYGLVLAIRLNRGPLLVVEAEKWKERSEYWQAVISSRLAYQAAQQAAPPPHQATRSQIRPLGQVSQVGQIRQLGPPRQTSPNGLNGSSVSSGPRGSGEQPGSNEHTG